MGRTTSGNTFVLVGHRHKCADVIAFLFVILAQKLSGNIVYARRSTLTSLYYKVAISLVWTEPDSYKGMECLGDNMHATHNCCKIFAVVAPS